MKINKLTKRLQKNRPMTMVSIRIPKDVIEDLKRVAPVLGFSGYQALMKAYIGQGLRADLERLEGSEEISSFIENLRKRGVKEKVISSAISDVRSQYVVVPEQKPKRNER
jgi:predicted transcriptional regulator